MKVKITILFAILFTLFACSETLEDRAFREAKEFTKKNCPTPLSRELTMDSMVFNKQQHTFIYYYSLSPKVDYENINKQEAKNLLLTQLRNQTAYRKYKDAGYSFRYIYYPLVDKKNRIIDITYTKEDYNI